MTYQVAWASELIALGRDLDQARSLLTEARSTASRHDCTAVEARAGALLSELDDAAGQTEMMRHRPRT